MRGGGGEGIGRGKSGWRGVLVIGAWLVTWKVSSNRQARVWRTKKNGRCPRRTCCVFTVPPDACGFSANAKRWPGEPKRGRRAPCRTCCTFTVQRDACGVNGIARHWPGEPTKNGDARSRLLRVNRPAGRARGLSRRAAEECYAVALRRAAHAIRTRPGLFGTFFPRHAACVRTANPAVRAMRRSESRLATPRRRASCRASRACCTEQRNA